MENQTLDVVPLQYVLTDGLPRRSEAALELCLFKKARQED